MFRPLSTPSAALAALAILALAAPAAADGPFAPLPLRFSVAPGEDGPAVDRAWIDAQVEHANRIFEPAGVSFETVAVEPLAPEHARLETRRDRHALGARLEDEVINVFIVTSLRDVDDPSRYRMGVHWRPRGYPGKHLVIVAAHASPTVLAHELGHFFGNRRHSDTPGNIMCYERGDVPPFFDDAQIRIIRASTRRFLESGELRPTSASETGG